MANNDLVSNDEPLALSTPATDSEVTEQPTTPSPDFSNDLNANNEKTTNDGKEDEEHKFQDGQLLRFVKVRFPGNARAFPFLIGNQIFSYGQKVMAMSDRGMDIGYINSFPYEAKFHKGMLPVHTISKIATEEDIAKKQELLHQEKRAENICLGLIEKYNLDMVLTHVEFIQFGKKAVFYFNAPDRVDFRNLVKDLVAELKMRIELRQISVRDRSAALGSIGPCGRQNCCSSFLKNYGTVNIKMAKNQNLAIVPTKINGVCGQVKCCIRFENEVYTHKRNFLPREGSFIKVANGDIGKVTKLHVLREEFEMLTDKGNLRRYALSQYDIKLPLPTDWKFPERFEHIMNETKTLIGSKIDLAMLQATNSGESLEDENAPEEKTPSTITTTPLPPQPKTPPPTGPAVLTNNTSNPPKQNNFHRNKNRRRR